MNLVSILEKATASPHDLNDSELGFLLRLNSKGELDALQKAAYMVKERHIGRRVSMRGVIEFGNYCSKNCYYCGIRSGNSGVKRYQIARDDILRMAKWAFEQKYGSIVLQSGEIKSQENTDFVLDVLQGIKEFSGGELGITLCLGEQEPEVYEVWRSAGAHRYLLRIETTNRELYGKIHPPDHDFDARMACLRSLKKLDYQVGTGIMSGLPDQTVEDLVQDLRFFAEFDIDMLGMGPYLPHEATPLGQGRKLDNEFRQRQLLLGLKMIACARLLLHDVNIAATTALQALNDTGREKGLRFGANVLMPNVTDTLYRGDYLLYEGKPCLDENSAQCRECLSHRVHSTGETIRWGEWGDSPHFLRVKNG